MRLRQTLSAAAMFLLGTSYVLAQGVSQGIVISQVYGGGGNVGATLRNDFVELFNRGGQAISITGWSLQYASATGTSWDRTLLTGVIQPGQYFLVQEAEGNGGAASLPTPDLSSGINLSAIEGKLALVNNSIQLTGAAPTGSQIVDFLGYGGANSSETSPAVALTNTTAAFRQADGCTDAANNYADFVSGSPSPRNSQSPVHLCVSLINMPPAVLSLLPVVSSGSNQALTITYNAPNGYQSLDVVNILINNVLDGRQACYLAYVPVANALYIVADNGDATQIRGSIMNGTGTVSNSQCSIALATSSATGTGAALVLLLDITFAPSFAGNKVIYAAARDSLHNSGWQTMGVHGVPPLPTTFPNPTGMTPASGTTSPQTITFTYQDESSATNLQTVWALVNTAIDGRAACYVAYYRPGNLLYLYPDNGDGNQAANIALTGNNTISNSQCTISAQGSSVQTNGNTLTVTLPFTFKPAFTGFKGVWLAAYTIDGHVSPWQALGAEYVPSP